MGRKKEPNKGLVPCLVCQTRHNYLTGSHLAKKHESDQPQDIKAYRDWVATEHEIDPEDPIFEPNQIQKPQLYRKHAKRLGLPTK